MTDGWSLGSHPGAVLVYDQAGDVVDANEAAGRLLGMTVDELKASNADDSGWLIVESVDEPISVHPAIAALRTGQPVLGVIARARRPDGKEVWLQVDAVPDGGSSVVATLTDVTFLIAHSRISSRSAGDHIVDEVTDSLAQARMEPRAILDAVTRTLARLRPGIWVASLMGKNPTDLEVVARNSDDADDYAIRYMDTMRRGSGVNSTPISNRVIESGQPLVIPEIDTAEIRGLLTEDLRGYMEANPWAGAAPKLGMIVVPMRARGAIMGTLGLFERRGSNPLTEKDTVWMQAIADRTALAVENAQLYADAVNRLDRLAALQSVSLAVSASPDLRLTLKVILDHVTAQLRIDAADILLLDEADNSLALAASTGFLATSVHEYRLPADDGMPGQALMSRRIETVTALSAFSQLRRRSLFAREGFKAYGAVPLISRGKLLGALEVFQRSTLTPDEEWLAFLEALGSVAAVAIDSATMQEKLRHARVTVQPRPASAPPDMSRLEREIMRLVVEGRTNREIADQVHLSQNTIKFHMRQILQKTGAANRTEMAHHAAKEGWL